ncbi:uncharacterized protein LOC114521614 isoform X1 [Dendronephthya gigantea]|uniref:uncharacterized protein LOC114521614 isoform X1 n=1 Tax=Dendronephthya gigantea TaxID=151771 RepID=UPI00106D1966|nr:uncharacterized protein LOC114521614 isoform X1 [Dendronephthya gigantea]
MADALSHPEILPLEKLQDILTSRGIPFKDLVNKHKSDLVQLFYRYVVPLPQRESNMRRANRLKIVRRKLIGHGKDRECKSRGIKRMQPGFQPDSGVKKPSLYFLRKNISSELNKRKTKEDFNFSHKISAMPLVTSSPTTECTNKVTKLFMNCEVSEPLNVNEECLENSKQNHSATKAKVTGQSSSLMEDARNENNSQSIKDNDTKTAKKFKRITVTWP